MQPLKEALSLLAQTLIFPQVCCLCRQPVFSSKWIPLCQACFSNLPYFTTAICPVCGIPSEGHCACCLASGAAYFRARAYGPYQGDLRDLIWNYKFQGFHRLSKPLSELLLLIFERYFNEEPPDLLIAVPSHRKRVAERGFDHIGRLVDSLSRSLGLPRFLGLKRQVNTQPQFGLDIDQRVRNLKKAFELHETDVLSNKSVLLVDDVMTTGTTVLRVCELLRDQSSVGKIDVLTVARVPQFRGAWGRK